MHYHLEIIIPPTTDIEAAVDSILNPYNENNSDDEEGCSRHAFYDWYEIGGRYSGDKFIQSLSAAKLEQFYQWAKDEKITVSGVRAGKQEISPASQIAKVDLKWCELFPSENGDLYSCPLFKHAGRKLESDILPLSKSRHVEAFRVIIAAPGFNYNPTTKSGTRDGPLKATLMLAKEIWNGTTHQETAWDGKISTALELHAKQTSGGKEEYLKAVTPTDDWLCVTVDYHS